MPVFNSSWKLYIIQNISGFNITVSVRAVEYNLKFCRCKVGRFLIQNVGVLGTLSLITLKYLHASSNDRLNDV